MADEISIDKKLFHRRLASFIAEWKRDKFGGVGSIVLCVGKASEGGTYTKPVAFQVCRKRLSYVRVTAAADRRI